MGLYTYRCDNCETNVEILQSWKERETVKAHCRKCMAVLRPTLGLPAFILREGGSGWARDGYRASASHGSVGEGCYSVKEGPRHSREEIRTLNSSPAEQADRSVYRSTKNHHRD
jgi:putative FmdB family regulatory protein